MYNIKRNLYIFLIGTIILNSFSPFFVIAEDTFNINNIISDYELQASTAMNRADIDAFLKEKGGAISNMKLLDKDGTIRETADIIYRASQEHSINPKYLLVKLQKEQSLIEDKLPTQKQLDWATGYGICDSCSMNDPALQKHKGFGVQVDSAAAIMRWYYDNLWTQTWIKRANASYIIDSTQVSPINHATAFLYTYTPHIAGNKNFWSLWQKWFEQVYPDGTLIKGIGNPTVYLIKDGKKSPFTNMSALISRFNPKLIIDVSTTELNNYENGFEITLPNYAILQQENNYYLLDNDTLRKFQSHETVKNLGYNPDEIITISPEEVLQYKIGPIIRESTNPEGRLVKIKENNAIYYVKDEQYFPVYDEQIASINYPNLNPDKISASELSSLVSGPTVLLKDGTLFGIEGESNIYVVEHGKKRHIVSEDIFNGLGYDWSNIVWLNTFAGIAHETGQPVYMKREIVQTTNTSNLASTDKIDNFEVVEKISLTDSKVQTTPVSDSLFIGPIFNTQVNTYLVADYDTGNILAGKNIDEVRPTASFAKIMTAYRLFKEGINLQESVTYNASLHKSIYHRYNIGEGDKVLNKDLLFAMLVSSLNTPVNMLVYSVDPDRQAFIRRMNEEASEMGLINTIFSDLTGESLETKTTAREFLTIFNKVVRNANIQSYLRSKSYSYDKLTNPSGKRKNHFDNNSNELMNKPNLTFKIKASKTGYLDEAGAGLALLIERKSDLKKFIIITMGNPNYINRFNMPEQFSEWALNTF